MSDDEKAVQRHKISSTVDDEHEARPSPIPTNVIETNTNTNTNTNTTQQVDSTSASTSELVSALEENIAAKGRNSYYYTHAHKAKGPKWDGKQEPKLLSREDLMALSLDPTTTNNTPSGKVPSFMYHKSTITSYAFLNEEKVVKLYIALDGISEQCTDDDITLDWDDSSLSLVIKNYKKEISNDDDDDEATIAIATGEDQSLSFSRLTGKITHAKYKLKTDKIILTLKKEKEGIEWHTINDKGTPIS